MRSATPTSVEWAAPSRRAGSIPAVTPTIAWPRLSPAGRAAAARYGTLACLLLAGVALIVAEFLTLREIVAVTVVPPGGRTSGGAHHGYALALIGVVSLPMAVGAVLGRSRPAAVALTALGALALAITLIVDLPSLDDEGLIGRTYDLAEASPGPGFWIQLVAEAVLIGIGASLVLRRQREARERDVARARRRAAAREPQA